MMDTTLDDAVAAVRNRHRDRGRKTKRAKLSVASALPPEQAANNLSTELQYMVAWGILHASAAAGLARKQRDDYELLGVPVPKELSQMASVGKSGEITGHIRRDFFKKLKPLPWLPTPVPARAVTKGKRGSAARYPFFTVVPVLMVNELFDALYHNAKDVFRELRGNLQDFWDKVRLNLILHV